MVNIRKSQRWTDEEDKKLLEYRKNGLTCREIQEYLPNRTLSGIRCRIQSLGINKIYPYIENQLKDLTGMRFGKLVVLKRASNDETGHPRWICDCACGNKDVMVYGQALKSGTQVSCGCHRDEYLKNFGGKRYYNEYNLSGKYGVGYCRNTGKQFLFDIDDYEQIKNYCWMEDANGYIVTFVSRKPIFMHRFVMGLDEKSTYEVDHIRHETNDNRKGYLRVVSHAENHRNNRKFKNNSSGETGVFFNSKDRCWCSRITYNGEIINLCRSKNKDDAIRARKEAEELYFGEYSYDNSMKYENKNYE